jgi:histidinol-phosphate/aromatic aminotransferase/cobyric acid decarboxylase-like protein
MINLKLGTIKEPLPDFILKKLKHALDNANDYPQNYNKLIEKLAKHHKISKDKILLVNGTNGSIDLITKVLANKVYYYEPTYYEFWAAPKRNNVKYEALQSLYSDKYVLKTRSFGKGTVLFLCNPNNPFGEIPLEQILDFSSKSKGYVAVDESYIEFSGKSPLRKLDKYPNLLLMRSFSKTYAMAGLRVGYIIAAPKLIKTLEEHKVFFDVSSASVEAALVVLDYHDYFKEQINQLIKRKTAFDDFLTEQGFNVIQNNINNTIIHFKSEAEASKFVKYLNKNNVLVNQGDGISTVGLDKSWVRFAYGTEEQMKKVTKIIEKYKVRTLKVK